MDACDAIYVVMQFTIPSIQDSKRLLSVLAGLGYPREKISLIANRVQRGGDIDGEDVQKALGVLVKHQIPNSWPAAVHTANHGVSIFDHAPKDPLCKVIAELAAMHSPSNKPTAQPNWLGQLFSTKKSS